MRFNGAALVGVRREGLALAMTDQRTTLQRGRTRGSAESIPDKRAKLKALVASTGPHSWECGELEALCA